VYAHPRELEAWRASRKPEPKARPPIWFAQHRRVLALTPIALAAMITAGGGRAAGVAPQAAGSRVEATQLWANPDIEGEATLSPDGRYLAYSSWAEDGNLMVKDLATGSVQQITRDAAVRTHGSPQPWSPIFSPDGSRIAYVWYERTGSSLRIVNRDGSNRRIVTRAGNVDLVYAWSPDGRSLAINQYDAGQSRLSLASIDDGTVVPISATGWRKAGACRFSPDGKFLVYALPAADESPDRGVFVLAVDGSSRVKLADGSSPTWTPDGSAVVFFSDRGGTTDLWMVPVADGKPAGAATVLKQNVAGTNPAFIRDGSLFFETRIIGREVLVASVDLQSRAPSLHSIESQKGSNLAASWSRDGQSLAMFRSEGEVSKLVVRTADAGIERTLSGPFPTGPLAQAGRWFPDGRSMLVRHRETGREVFRRVDVQSGEHSALFNIAVGGAGFYFDLSPDGTSVYLVRREEPDAPEGVRSRVIRREMASGEEIELYRTAGGEVRGLTLSPDGLHLAIKNGSVLLLLPTGGGAPAQIQRGPDALEPLAWTRDGRNILGVRQQSDRDHLWAVPVTGEPAVDLGFSAENIATVSVSPADGRLAMSIVRPGHELWLLRNLLKPSADR
jgi:Tol biopolymer transport system component